MSTVRRSELKEKSQVIKMVLFFAQGWLTTFEIIDRSYLEFNSKFGFRDALNHLVEEGELLSKKVQVGKQKRQFFSLHDDVWHKLKKSMGQTTETFQRKFKGC